MTIKSSQSFRDQPSVSEPAQHATRIGRVSDPAEPVGTVQQRDKYAVCWLTRATVGTTNSTFLIGYCDRYLCATMAAISVLPAANSYKKCICTSDPDIQQ